jgi:hypothetical protein
MSKTKTTLDDIHGLMIGLQDRVAHLVRANMELRKVADDFVVHYELLQMTPFGKTCLEHMGPN